ncbi:iron(III) transport system ATP-binding protein [Litorivivens lipolytica]|uniref:Iron(III) transport system ATP-binding protein n=1 Tax=Litorivivens lipolytica TaxID=1524264 RepID=A0A7W4Z5S7_9GAMM|nr:ABC transporter ATP-binding protein [Litorivivens lipolytica]MBB3047417.1 iron(III) transport system ATP-binding protein [Litorivivens lipolytica]
MLQVKNIQCQYDGEPVIDDISFHVNEGDICTLLGPSGCGKTTALRAIAGFQPIDQGEILLGETTLSKPGFSLDPELREVGMVFQDYALFPHLTVKQNICFGFRKTSRTEQNRIVSQLLELVRLNGVEDRYPHELSGGQQQRVALARALAPAPKLLLLDEPFSNLDAELRKSLSLEVRDILKDYGISAILVTHDQEEAFAFSDQIGLLYHGALQQWDTPFNLYHEPANRLVAEFIGRGSFVPGTVTDHHSIQTELGDLLGNRAYPWPENSRVDVLLRPDDIVLSDFEGVEATVEKKVFNGGATLYTLALPTGSKVEALLPSHRDFPLGETIAIEADVEHLIAFHRDEELVNSHKS